MTATIEQLKEKIELFRKNIKDYKSKDYDEYNTRADFIDVLFSALGWDMYNEQKIIEQFREVVREDKIVIEGSKRAPDYSFRIGPHIVFYVEAKKPAVDVKNDYLPALQLRRYAYTRGLALSIVTDFEEIAVYDTRIKPDKKDSAAVARVFYCTYNELFLPCKIEGYETNFDFLLNTFGKQAVLNGSFNRYVETNKKGTTSVDKGFLELLNKWREKLAESIALKNEDIDEYNLNIVVQKLIDRLIFLRIAEDRLIEKPNLLFDAAHKSSVYTELNNIFAVADVKYNSNLFSSEPWMMALNVDDKVLNEIIDEMYPPKCPYEFSVLPIEILGHAYEQFLGKTIKFTRKTKFGHSIEIEEKPEVRKAGGVYYTPDYIVDYIVENTVGVKLNGTSTTGLTDENLCTESPRTPGGGKDEKRIKPLAPEEVASLKILDPACGSGSFLIGAYDYLIRYHLEYYVKNKTRREKALSAGIIYQAGGEKYKLSTKTKSEILVNNIFGVDIDPQAVEVTKLSLLLKVLEDENLEYREQLFKTEQMHMLPDLSKNIKCGNSLIGSDYYADKNLTMFGQEEMRKVNVFDWEEEFLTSPPAPLLKGEGRKTLNAEWGFDCVIGNPPYVAVDFSKSDKEYFNRKYLTAQYQLDLYILFIERSVKVLKQNALIGLITPNSWLKNLTMSNCRLFLLQSLDFKKIVPYLPNVFPAASVDALIFTGIKSDKQELISIEHLVDQRFIKSHTIDQAIFLNNDKYVFTVAITSEIQSIIDKMKNDVLPLNSFFDITRGVNPYDVYTGQTREVIDSKAYHSSVKKDDTFVPELRGKHIKRYFYQWDGKHYISYGPWLAAPRDVRFFKGQRILFREILGKRFECTFIEEDFIIDRSLYIALIKNEMVEIIDIKYLLGILCSKLLPFYFRYISNEFDELFPKIRLAEFKLLPIKQRNKDHEMSKRIVASVDSMLESQKQLQSAKTDSDRKILQQKIDAIDKQIDRLVYELYGLSEDEIKIVEGAG